MLIKRLAMFWRALRFEGRVMWQVVRNPLTPLWIKALAVAPFIYFISPVDFIPDVIPFMGQLDDAIMLAFIPKIWSWLIERTHPEVREAALRHVGTAPIDTV